MNNQRVVALLLVALAVIGGGLWLTSARHSAQSVAANEIVLPGLKAALNDVTEIRLKKGDGADVTLKRDAVGWQVAQRGYAADSGRIRKLLLDLAEVKLREPKTSDPANYAKLGVEDADSPAAASTLLEVVAPQKTWSLLIGKQDTPRSGFVRVSGNAQSALVEPLITVEVDPKRWLDRQILDIAAKQVQSIVVTPTEGPAYTAQRASAEDANLVLQDIPAGKAVASPAAANATADALAALTFDDVRKQSATSAAKARAEFKLFDGKAFALAGAREGERTYIAVSGDGTIAGRLAGWEFEIPSWKYNQIFKPRAELLQQ
jgi:hypothetical protein